MGFVGLAWLGLAWLDLTWMFGVFKGLSSLMLSGDVLTSIKRGKIRRKRRKEKHKICR